MRQPRDVWPGLPPALRQQVIDDITAIYAEVIHEHFRTHYPVPSRPQGPDLCPAVQPAPGPHATRRAIVFSMPSSNGPLNAAGHPRPSRSSTPTSAGHGQHHSGPARVQRDRHPGHSRPGRHHLFLRCHPAVTQLHRLVPGPRPVRLPPLPHRRSRRDLRPRHDQRAPLARVEGPDLGAGAPYDQGPADGRPAQQGPARRAGPDPPRGPRPRRAEPRREAT